MTGSVPEAVNGKFQLDDLLHVKARQAPKAFEPFWQECYQRVLRHRPKISLQDTGETRKHWKIYDVYFESTQGVTIGGWLLLPESGVIRRGFVISHGYSGRTGPDFYLPFDDAALYFPCCRGISRSPHHPISPDPYWHVLHDIDKNDEYIIRGCVEDVWLSVTVLLTLYPHLTNRIGLLGTSFGGGIGTLALAQDHRIAKAHFNVPTFGHHSLRLRIPTEGSGRAVQDFFKREPHKLIRTIRMYDAAFAARLIRVPVHYALALKDDVVTPPGQFSIFNETHSDKQLFVLDAGHQSYPNQNRQYRELKLQLKTFFQDL